MLRSKIFVNSLPFSIPTNLSMKISKSQAFTLIELLVVISIIAILAGIALPVFSQVQVKGAQTKALSNAKQIGLACRLYADDHNGNYPTYKLDNNDKETANKVSDSNEAFGNLIPDYVQTEQIFFVPKSAFTKVPPDEKFTSGQKLTTGENHFALVQGLGTTSPSTYPLIADGFSSESGHTYTDNESAKGGVWKGKKAIIIKADNSGVIEKLNKQFKVPGSPNGNDLFDNSGQQDWMGSDNTVVNPK